MMVLRPEGLLPSARRRAELHPEDDAISLTERETLYGARETGGGN